MTWEDFLAVIVAFALIGFMALSMTPTGILVMKILVFILAMWSTYVTIYDPRSQ